jgi:hypothetical protein
MLKSKDRTPYDMYYLQGEIYFQIYAPLKSSETRLIHIKDTPKEDFQLKMYNIENYDGKLYYFNMRDRKKKYEYGDSRLMKYHLLGYDDSYESVGEYCIIDRYLSTSSNKSLLKSNKLLKKELIVRSTKYKDIIQKIYEINESIIKLTHKDIVLCTFNTTISKKPEDFNIRLNNIKKIDRVNELISQIKNIYISTIFSLKNQYYYFGKGSILSHNNYKKMREDIPKKFNDLNKHLKHIVDKEYLNIDSKFLVLNELVKISDQVFEKILKEENNEDNLNFSNGTQLAMYNKFIKLVDKI